MATVRTPANTGGAIQRAATNGTKKPVKPTALIKAILDTDKMRKQFEDVLGKNAAKFVASIIDLYNGDTYLQQCEPIQVCMEALKAASLDLPINKQLGFAYIVPYKGVAAMQIGYKGYIQLAKRSGLYRCLNADVVYEGELVGKDKLSGDIDLTGERVSDTIIGYFAYIEELNGFRKVLYMSREEVSAWMNRYSKSAKRSGGAWSTNFDEMAIKTCLRRLISKWGTLSVDLRDAIVADAAGEDGEEGTPSPAPQEEAVETEYRLVDEATGEVVRVEEVADAPLEGQYSIMGAGAEENAV